MKKIFSWIGIVLLLQLLTIEFDNYVNGNHQTSQHSSAITDQPSPLNISESLVNKPIGNVARQLPAAEAPVETRKSFSWWWWIIGVAVIVAAGMLGYTLIKKNPRKDVR